MNLRHPKAIRLGGWGAALATLLVVAAGSYLAVTFLQTSDVLNGGIIAGVTVASGLFGGLLSYCLFVFARMQPAPASAPAVIATEQEAEEAVVVEEMPADEDEAIAISVAKSPLPPPELSDDAIPVFVGSHSTPTGADDSVADLLVVPPPLDAVDDSDSIAVERSVSAEDFDSAMDLPVRIEAPELNVEDMDDVPPVVLSQTTSVVSALTQTEEVEVPTESMTPEPMLPDPVAENARPSLPDSFPDIFKSMPLKAPPVSGSAAPAPSTPPAAPPKPAPAPVQKVAPPRPAVARSAPQPVDEASLPVVDDLSDIAITLGPVTPTGVLPSEIPDFFLKMPTGRSTPGSAPSMPVMPVAPVAPRQVVSQPKPAHPVQAVVRIIDSTTVEQEADDMVTMTAIPDDWPS
jgi:hypothetical protein